MSTAPATPPHDRFRHWATTIIAQHYAAGRAGHHAQGTRELYQSSTMGALLDGVYVGDVTIAEILRHGDFGLGTFNHLDGEMVILDGVCYHLHADGSTTVAADSERTPFAAVTRFRTDLTFEITESTNRVDAVAQIDSLIGSENLMYAIRINGGFSEMRTRTVMAQSPPYPPLIKATESQAETRFTDVTGALAGFRLPYYDQGISVAGYHLHFLDENRNQGGHALDFQLSHGTVSVCTLSDLHLSLPGTPEFLGANLATADADEQICQAEGGH
ncbi:MAG: acetolactate decarboxylase [Mycobacterium sp.]|jgi:acetolactate decarboxylase|nr:alpha-acetolactate decarboxylase [Mycobacterium sp.]MDT5132168.1 acetolactate decarboxylase [Mycobacterium sp.]